MMDAAAFAEKVAHGQLSMLPRDWRPPAFLLRGMMLTTDNQECRGVTLDQILALRASQMAQDGQEAAEPQSENPLLLGKGSSDDTDVGIGPQAAQEAPEASGGHIPAPEPATPATEAPSPALTASDADRAAALAELGRFPPGTQKRRPRSSAWPASSRTPVKALAAAGWR